jgi:hypothetical protein
MDFTRRLKDVASKFVEIEHNASPTSGPPTNEAPTLTRTLLQVSESPEDIRRRFLPHLSHLPGTMDGAEGAGADAGIDKTEQALRVLRGLPSGMSQRARQNTLKTTLQTTLPLESVLVDVTTKRAAYVWERERQLSALEQEAADCQHLLREISSHLQALLTVRREIETQTDTRVRHLDTLVHLLSEDLTVQGEE